jgi:hypothetical protein
MNNGFAGLFIGGVLCISLLSAQSTSSPVVTLTNSIKSLIAAGQFTDAARASGQLVNAVYARIKATPPASFESSVQPQWSPSNVTVATALELIDSIDKFDASGDLIAERDFANALVQVTGRVALQSRPTPAQILATEQQASQGATLFQQYLAAPPLARAAYDTGDLVLANNTAQFLLRLAAANPKWPQGEAIFTGNMVAGLVALDRGDIAAADAYLLASGQTKGSPRLKTFGPGMALANALIQKGQKEVVIEFLTSCGKFWTTHPNSQTLLAGWQSDVAAGKTPDFGPNLLYY